MHPHNKEDVRKEQCIVDIIHALRTPLAIMKGNIELALLSKDKEFPATTLKNINAEIDRLSTILSELASKATKK